jgi:hypothetical protein
MHVLYYAGSMAGSKAEDDCAERLVATGAGAAHILDLECSKPRCRCADSTAQCVVTEPKEAEIDSYHCTVL